MVQPTALVFPIEKAIYLFSRETVLGQGGDKQKFWRGVLGFESPEAIRTAILDSLTVADLAFQRQDQYGERYQAISYIQGKTGVSWWIRTGWIVRSGETSARFITAIPAKARED
ncbi:MAG: DUF6883 domain-containing protein [Cyanobacteria bacterium P01_D01_bin.6]